MRPLPGGGGSVSSLYLSGGPHHAGSQQRLRVPVDLLAGPRDQGAEGDRRWWPLPGLLGSSSLAAEQQQRAHGEDKASHGTSTATRSDTHQEGSQGFRVQKRKGGRAARVQVTQRLKNGSCWRRITGRALFPSVTFTDPINKPANQTRRYRKKKCLKMIRAFNYKLWQRGTEGRSSRIHTGYIWYE